MKKQKKIESFIETFVQTFLGLTISFLIQLFLYPLLGIPVTFEQNIVITLVFFVASLLRGYFIRRLFINFSK